MDTNRRGAPTLDEIARDASRVGGLSDEALTALASLSAAAQCAIAGAQAERVLASVQRTDREMSPDGDRLLTIAQAAELLSVSKSWLYHKAARLGIARKLGDGTLRFSFVACQRLIKNTDGSRSRGVSSTSKDSV